MKLPDRFGKTIVGKEAFAKQQDVHVNYNKNGRGTSLNMTPAIKFMENNIISPDMSRDVLVKTPKDVNVRRKMMAMIAKNNAVKGTDLTRGQPES